MPSAGPLRGLAGEKGTKAPFPGKTGDLPEFSHFLAILAGKWSSQKWPFFEILALKFRLVWG